jgi:hypothetical protein
MECARRRKFSKKRNHLRGVGDFFAANETIERIEKARRVERLVFTRHVNIENPDNCCPIFRYSSARALASLLSVQLNVASRCRPFFFIENFIVPRCEKSLTVDNFPLSRENLRLARLFSIVRASRAKAESGRFRVG